jgi:hypothetical protein
MDSVAETVVKNIPQINPDTTYKLDRPARALLGWMNDERAKFFLSGGLKGIDKPEYAEKILRTRESVNSRPAGLNQTEILEEPPDELQNHINKLIAHPRSSIFFAEGWTVKIVDLPKVCAAQAAVFIDHTEERVLGIDPSDINSIASVTIPIPSDQPELLPQFDEKRNTWILSSSNPNVRIAGRFSSSTQNSTVFGFIVQVVPSYMKVASLSDRYILCDGYHRAYDLIKRGITKVPVLVRNVVAFEDIKFPPGILQRDAYLGDRPALLQDYHDESVSEEIRLPGGEKLIIIQGLELVAAHAP